VAGRVARQTSDAALDLAGVARVDRTDLDAEERPHGLDRAQLPAPGRDARIAEDRRAGDAGRNLLEQLEPFSAHAVFDAGKPRRIAARTLMAKPPPTGSLVFTNTIGTVRVARCSGAMPELPLTKITSGASATNSAADLRMRSASAEPQRYSSRTLRPSVQPSSCKPCRNAPTRASDSGSSAVAVKSSPMRRIGCCALAASGHAAAAPPRSVMKSRRWIWIAIHYSQGSSP